LFKRTMGCTSEKRGLVNRMVRGGDFPTEINRGEYLRRSARERNNDQSQKTLSIREGQKHVLVEMKESRKR